LFNSLTDLFIYLFIYFAVKILYFNRNPCDLQIHMRKKDFLMQVLVQFW